MSPDGQRLVYNTSAGLFLRSLHEQDGRLLAGTEETLTHPFFSPDGRSIGYFQAGQLKRLAVASGALSAIVQASNPFGVSWAPDDMIHFGQPEGIMRVSARGGAPELVVSAREGEQMDSPQLLPDGESLLFSVSAPTPFQPVNRWDSAQVVVQSLRSQARKVLVRPGSDARYVAPGYLVYAVEDRLLAVRFDPDALDVRSEPISVVEGLGRAFATASANYEMRSGTLVHAVGTRAASLVASRLAWVDRFGKREPIGTIAARRFTAPRLSPDGQRVLVIVDGNLQVFDLSTGRETRVTQDGSTGGYAAWRSDGTVAYTSMRGEREGRTNAWMQPVEGTASAIRLTAMDGQVDVDSWSHDGRTLAVHNHKPGGESDLLMISVAGERASAPSPFHPETASERNAVFSPDGRFVAYISDETGRFEVYVRPFPGPAARQPVSVGGAADLSWGRNGELFFRRLEDSVIIAVPVATSPALSIGRPRELFRVAGLIYGTSATRYDVTADGTRFLMLAREVELDRVGASVRPTIRIVLNWQEELKQRLP